MTRLFLLLTLFPTAHARAAEPVWRWLTADDGLAQVQATELVQGSDGFIWIATRGGVFRWDGSRVQRADHGEIRVIVSDLAALDGDAVVALDELQRLWLLRAEQTRELALPSECDAPREVGSTAGGELLLTCTNAVLTTPDGERWTRLLRASDRIGELMLSRPGRHEGELLVASRRGWWIGAPSELQSVAPVLALPTDGVAMPDGSLWLAESGYGLRHLDRDGGVLHEVRNDHAFRSVVRHGPDMWASSGRALFRHRAGSDQVHTWQDGAYGVLHGGPLLVDEEGSLWMGTFRGIGILAEPDAVRIDEEDGLAETAFTHAAFDGRHLWLGSWRTSVVVDPTSRRARDLDHAVPARTRVCVDGGGRGWAVHGPDEGGGYAFVAFDAEGRVRLRHASTATSRFRDSCASLPDGSVLFTAGRGLWRLGVGDDVVREAELPFAPSDTSGWRFVHVTSGPTLWISSNERLCRAPLAQRARPEAWSCHQVENAGLIYSVVETERGSIWVGTRNAGLLVVGEDGSLQRHPGSDELPTENVRRLRASPQGGVWITGTATVIRVVDQPDAPRGWQVQERLSDWVKPLAGSPADLVELDNGDLWLAGAAGLSLVPASARTPPSRAPRVRLLEQRVDGRPTPGQPLVLPNADGTVGLRFSAASFRAPRMLRYRMRLDGAAWSEPERSAAYQFVDLAPGSHRVEVQASLDRQSWSEPAVVHIRVPRPWYRSPLVWLAAVGLIAVVAGLVVRARVVLRLRWERLRTRIAMDLHDEVGAGLASIELLGGLLSRPMPEESRQDIAHRVRDTAAELGRSMRAIVWSLKPESLHVHELGAFIEERARTLLVDLDERGGLSVARSGLQGMPALDLHVLRNVQLIALEALHNVYRHARAERVDIHMLAEGSRRYRLIIEDDGVGCDAGGPDEDGGNGLRSMRRRAAAIGATLTIDVGPLEGTRVTLAFSGRSRGATPHDRGG